MLLLVLSAADLVVAIYLLGYSRRAAGREPALAVGIVLVGCAVLLVALTAYPSLQPAPGPAPQTPEAPRPQPGAIGT